MKLLLILINHQVLNKYPYFYYLLTKVRFLLPLAQIQFTVALIIADVSSSQEKLICHQLAFKTIQLFITAADQKAMYISSLLSLAKYKKERHESAVRIEVVVAHNIFEGILRCICTKSTASNSFDCIELR